MHIRKAATNTLPVFLLALLSHSGLAQSGTFTNTGDLQHDRAFHADSLIRNGSQVLVSAGVNSDGDTINRAEIFNGVSSWAYTGSLNHDRKYHTQTTLLDGTVLVVGGENNDGNTLNTAELWSPSTGKWTYVGNLVHDRAFHTATLLSDGTVLIAGGENNNHNTINAAELYHPSTKTFTAVGNLQHDRASHTATLIPAASSPTGRDIVVIAGGHNDDPDPTHSAETYDPSTQTFTLCATSLQQDRSNHAAAYIPSIGKVLVASGVDSSGHTINTAELYDPASRTWSFTGQLVHDRQYLTANTLSSNSVLVAGGRNQDGSTVQYAELYNPSTGSWTNTGYLIHDRSNHSATYIKSGSLAGSVVVAGGRDDDGDTIHSTEIYHP